MASSGRPILLEREIIIVVDDDDDHTSAPFISIDEIAVEIPKIKNEESKKNPKQNRTLNQGQEYIDLCKENLDNKYECKAAFRSAQSKKRGNNFSQDEPRNMNARQRGLNERVGVDADGRAAAVAVHDVPPQPPTLFRLSPNSNEYKEVRKLRATIKSHSGIQHLVDKKIHSLQPIRTNATPVSRAD
jgi:hypothetical protein